MGMLLGTAVGAGLIFTLMAVEELAHRLLEGDDETMKRLHVREGSRFYRSVERKREKMKQAVPDLSEVASRLRILLDSQQQILVCAAGKAIR